MSKSVKSMLLLHSDVSWRGASVDCPACQNDLTDALADEVARDAAIRRAAHIPRWMNFGRRVKPLAETSCWILTCGECGAILFLAEPPAVS